MTRDEEVYLGFDLIESGPVTHVSKVCLGLKLLIKSVSLTHVGGRKYCCKLNFLYSPILEQRRNLHYFTFDNFISSKHYEIVLRPQT